MTLLDYYADSFKPIQNSPLYTLIGGIKAFNFDKGLPEEGADLSDHVGIGDHVGTQTFLEAFVNNGLSNFVQTSNDDLMYELFIAAVILKKPLLFLNNPLTILNSQHGSANAMNVWQENFNCTEHKARVLDSIEKFIGNNKGMNRLSENILIIIDELFSNALFNAPVDDNGYPIFKNMERDEKVKYPGNKNARIFAVHTQHDLFIGTIDPWGSIDRDHISNILHRAYSERKVTEDSKGAGFGLRMMLDRARSLYILSQHRERSLVCCHMRLNISLKKIENVPKQLHINCFG
ncbi:MAG: hypothetical protein KDD33_12125 [Bdellovibrionales bacterium]|nr:hypothetical protein [Bdellovibrionales bacterium]